MSDKDKARTRVVGRKQEEVAPAPAGGEAAPGTAGTPLAFDACVASVDSMLGAGNGSPVCHLMSAKWGNPAAASDPEAPAILIPQDLTMEQAVEQCVEVGTSADLFELKKIDGGESTLPIFGKLLSGIKAIAQHVGLNLDGETKGKDDAMSPEERKEFDELKGSVAGLEKKLDGVGDTIPEAIGKALGKDPDGDQGKDTDKEKAMEKAEATDCGDKDKDDDEKYPEWALELRDAIVGIGKRIDEVETKGLSDQVFEVESDGGTKSGACDGNRMVKSGLLGIPISEADADAQRKRHEERRKRRAERRAETGPVRMRGGAGS